jgi:DNA cross-link repair 1B protein
LHISSKLLFDQIIALIQANRDHRIIIGMRQLGKEDLLVKIALKFQEWISVPLAMYRTAEILGLQDVFCVDDMDCQIRIVPFHTVTRSSVISWNDFDPTLAILPTSLYIGLGSTPYVALIDNWVNTFWLNSPNKIAYLFKTAVIRIWYCMNVW